MRERISAVAGLIIQIDRFRYGLPGTVSTPSNLIVLRSNKGACSSRAALVGMRMSF